MEILHHLLGVCHDSHSHLDLLDILIGSCNGNLDYYRSFLNKKLVREFLIRIKLVVYDF